MTPELRTVRIDVLVGGPFAKYLCERCRGSGEEPSAITSVLFLCKACRGERYVYR
jgi:hypothetical protein